MYWNFQASYLDSSTTQYNLCASLIRSTAFSLEAGSWGLSFLDIRSNIPWWVRPPQKLDIQYSVFYAVFGVFFKPKKQYARIGSGFLRSFSVDLILERTQADAYSYLKVCGMRFAIVTSGFNPSVCPELFADISSASNSDDSVCATHLSDHVKAPQPSRSRHRQCVFL
jgi:hypothetical protein